MNNQLKEFARRTIKDGLAKCTGGQVHIFKRMYSFKNMDTDINTIVDNMPDEKLDWAMEQVRRTLEKEAQATT